jgi:hypothetical protein
LFTLNDGAIDAIVAVGSTSLPTNAHTAPRMEREGRAEIDYPRFSK